MLAALRERRHVQDRVAIVVAHPDDETIAAGGSLYLFPNLLLIHVTDGAPRALGDAAREGFADPEAYAAARQAELDAALALSGAAPERILLGIPDQDASLAIPAIAARLRTLFRTHGLATVLTHAYEGGHPDHDATALATHLAAQDGPTILEFPAYHAAPNGSMVPQRFLEPSPPGLGAQSAPRQGHGASPITVPLSPEEAARKAAMLACFRTQAAILSQFDATKERFRAAPAYDFTLPPHPGPLNYENWGWCMTGDRWRSLAAAAMGAACPA